MTTKTKQTFDDALVDYVSTLRTRIYDFGDTHATDVRTDDIDAALCDVDTDQADAVIAVTAGILSNLYARVEAAMARMGNRSFVARAMASQLSAVFTTVANSRTDPALHHAVEAADAERRRLEALQASTLLDLEAAVTSADIDAVLRLRPEIEVALPSKLDKARLAHLDAQLTLHRHTLDAVQQLTASATRAHADTQHRVDEARAALDAAAEAHASSGLVHQHTDAAVQQIRSTVRELDSERATCAALLKKDEQRRIRRLANLPEPTAEPVEVVDRNPFGHTAHESQFAS